MKNTWRDKWIEDIDYLRDNLIKNHKNLFFNTSKAAFENRIEDLKAQIDELDYDEMKVELSRLVATIKDAHTAITFPANRYLPLKFYWFQDGIYIINSTQEYKNLLYKKVLAINGIEIMGVLKEVSEIISFENEYLLKAQSIKYIQVAEVLYGLMIIDFMDEVEIKVDNEVVKINICSGEEIEYINQNLPLYAENSNKNLWYKWLDTKELYIKYNFCRESGTVRIEDKIKEIINFIEENLVVKVTIDLRNNMGGDSTLIRLLIDYIRLNSKINTSDNLRVIIGRETFSSGLLNAYQFKFETNAKILGEPSGGKPNCYGEILKFKLPNSKFIISYSTEYYKLIDDDNIMALMPDEYIYESIEDYMVN